MNYYTRSHRLIESSAKTLEREIHQQINRSMTALVVLDQTKNLMEKLLKNFLHGQRSSKLIQHFKY